MIKPKVDIVVCAYNEAERVPIILQSLREQTAPKASFSIIFVDNNSSDNTKAVVEEHSADLDLTYIVETKQGSNHARNAGSLHATADYIAFTDADIKLDKNWVEQIQTVITNEAPYLFGGPYYPYYKEKPPVWYKDDYNSQFHGDTARYLDLAREDISAANMIWRRETLLAQGSFNPDRGVISRSLARGAETELFQRCIKNIPDFAIYYDPQVFVYHYTRPMTYSLWYWLKRNWATGTADPKIFNDLPQYQKSVPVLLWESIRLIWTILIGLLYGLFRRDKQLFPHFANYLFEKTFAYIRFLGRYYTIIRKKISKTQ